jgi:hypothetical protein
MEIIKKTINRALTKEIIDNKNNFIVKPDLNAIYWMKILLTSKSMDFGFFDYYEENIDYYGYGQTNPIGLNNLL